MITSGTAALQFGLREFQTWRDLSADVADYAGRERKICAICVTCGYPYPAGKLHCRWSACSRRPGASKSWRSFSLPRPSPAGAGAPCFDMFSAPSSPKKFCGRFESAASRLPCAEAFSPPLACSRSPGMHTARSGSCYNGMPCSCAGFLCCLFGWQILAQIGEIPENLFFWVLWRNSCE